MRKARFGAVSLLVAGLWGCGPAPAPVTPQPVPTATVAAPAEVPTTVAVAGPDVSPVAEPTDIIALARWRNPMATASNLASCAGVAPILVEVNARMGVNLVLREVLQRSVDTRKIAALIALDAPVDAISTLDPGARVRTPLFAVAVGLTSLDGAKAAIAAPGQEPAEVAPGLWRLGGGRDVACVVAASAGATPARLVCAPQEKMLTALAPYLARTAPSLELGGADMHVEGRVDVLRKRYGDGILKLWRAGAGAVKAEYQTGDQRFDAFLFDGATAVQEDVATLFGDLHRITIEGKSEPRGTCLRATAAIDLSAKTSFLAQTLTDRLDRSAAPPPLYWLQPKDSQLAFYGRGVDPARFSTVLAKTREILEAGLATESFGSAADRKKIADLLVLPFGKDTNVVVSHGAVNVPIPDPSAKGGPSKVADAMFARTVGWTLIGADEGPAAMKKQLKALVDAYKLAGVQAGLKKELGARDAKMLPVVKAGTAPASLGAGAEAVEITIPNVEAPGEPEVKQPAPSKGGPPAKGAPVKGPPTMTLKLHVILMGDGASSWLAIGASKDDLVKRLLAVKAGAGAADQLGARTGLDTLRNGKQMFGGFVSASLVGDKVSAVYQGLTLLEPQYARPDDVKFAQALLALPNRGMTPVIFTANGVPSTDTTRLDIALEAQQGTFEDAKALVLSSYGFFSRMGLVP
jgi:hypothetical protein